MDMGGGGGGGGFGRPEPVLEEPLAQQGDDRKGLVANYEIYAGMEKDAMQRVAEGEFSNIRNNPVMQEVFFTPTHCRYVQLRATRMVNAGEKIAYQQVIIR